MLKHRLSAKSEASACTGTWSYSSTGAELHLPWLSFIRFLSADFPNLSVVPVQRDIIMLPGEKSSAPGGLTQCLFFKSHWLMYLHNFHSARKRTGRQPAHMPASTSSPGSQVSLWGQPPGTTWEMPRTEEYVHKGEGKNVNDFREIIIIVCLFWENQWLCM